MKKFIFLITLALFFSSPAKAVQDNVFLHPVKNENLGEVKKSIPKPSILRGNFEQTKIMKGLDKNFISTGTFVFAGNKGLYWNMQKPFSSIIVFTKNGLMQIEDGKKNLLEADKKPVFGELANIFQTIFVADTEKLKEYFDIFFVKNNQEWTLGLKPKDNIMKNVASKITITGKAYANKIVLEEQYGDSTIIKFKNISLNPQKLTQNEENYFKF